MGAEHITTFDNVGRYDRPSPESNARQFDGTSHDASHPGRDPLAVHQCVPDVQTARQKASQLDELLGPILDTLTWTCPGSVDCEQLRCTVPAHPLPHREEEVKGPVWRKGR